jgi:mannose-6-phosphate isomerase-like protein (cupin superfamily)
MRRADGCPGLCQLRRSSEGANGVGSAANTVTDEDLVVVRGLSIDARPAWSDVTSAGAFRVEPGGRFDRHYHDCDEYWLVFAGRARVTVGDSPYEVAAGDIVCTPTGTEHDVVGVYETLEAFWFEGRTPPGGRIGHLHRTDEAAQGHEVPPLADDRTGTP